MIWNDFDLICFILTIDGFYADYAKKKNTKIKIIRSYNNQSHKMWENEFVESREYPNVGLICLCYLIALFGWHAIVILETKISKIENLNQSNPTNTAKYARPFILTFTCPSMLERCWPCFHNNNFGLKMNKWICM